MVEQAHDLADCSFWRLEHGLCWSSAHHIGVSSASLGSPVHRRLLRLIKRCTADHLHHRPSIPSHLQTKEVLVFGLDLSAMAGILSSAVVLRKRCEMPSNGSVSSCPLGVSPVVGELGNVSSKLYSAASYSGPVFSSLVVSEKEKTLL